MDDISTVLPTDDQDIELAARSLKAMSHPLRLKILCALGSNEISVQDIVGILVTRKHANRVYYRIGDNRMLRLIVMMREVFCDHAP